MMSSYHGSDFCMEAKIKREDSLSLTMIDSFSFLRLRKFNILSCGMFMQ